MRLSTSCHIRLEITTKNFSNYTLPLIYFQQYLNITSTSEITQSKSKVTLPYMGN